MDGAAGPVDHHAVFSVLTAPKAVLAPDLTILDANESLLRTIGAPASAVVGRRYLDVSPSRGRTGAPSTGSCCRSSASRGRDVSR